MFLVSRLLHRQNDHPCSPLTNVFLTHSFNIYSDFAYITVLFVQFTRIGSPMINSGSQLSFPYRIRETWYHTICEGMRKYELF